MAIKKPTYTNYNHTLTVDIELQLQLYAIVYKPVH